MDVQKIRLDFPYLEEEPRIIYLDNAATTQRPRQVLDRVMYFYTHENANPLRGNHRLCARATKAYEEARAKVAAFIGAEEKEEIVFTRNATESLNLIAYSYGLNNLKEGDEILISIMEHHSNSVTWQMVAEKTGAVLRYFGLKDDFTVDLEDYKRKLNDKTKVVAFTGASNVLATMPPAKEMIALAKEKGAITVLDGAQLAPHERVNVQDLDCDFFVLSGHKMLAPMGIGVLYGKRELLEAMPPFLRGGEMIEYVKEQSATFAPIPYKFEAGTQNVGGAVGLGAAIDYLEEIGLDEIQKYERELTEYCFEKMQKMDHVTLYHPTGGPTGTSILFNIDGAHPHDVSTILDYYGIAIRSGHHCTQPLHHKLCIQSSCRASFAFYNTKEEIDFFLGKIKEVREVLGLGS